MSKNYLKRDVLRRSYVLQTLGISKADVKRDVKIFVEWGRQQKHLPQDYLSDELFVERLLLNNKFRIEQSKIKYDNYLTLRTMHRMFYEELWKIKPSEIPVVRIPLKKLTEDGKWIILICVQENINGNKDFLDCMKLHIIVTEIMNKYCYADGRVVILDFKGLRSSLFKNFDIATLHRHLKIMKACFSGRTSNFHMINVSNWSSYILAGVKLMFKGETMKLKVHEDLVSLYHDIPREYLPKEYGGECISVREYLEIWDEIIKEEEPFLKELQMKVPDERLRPEPIMSNMEVFGVDGTFKKLNID